MSVAQERWAPASTAHRASARRDFFRPVTEVHDPRSLDDAAHRALGRARLHNKAPQFGNVQAATALATAGARIPMEIEEVSRETSG